MTFINFLCQVNIYLLLFYGFYAAVLQHETFFRLNRIYLVLSSFISFVIPVIQTDFIQNLFVTEQLRTVAQASLMLDTVNIGVNQPNDSHLSIYTVLIWIYLAGVLIAVSKFTYKLWQIYKSGKNQDQAYSFFNKVVVSHDLEQRDVILEHEYVHVRQWHSADVILFELIAIINWFNPIVYYYKRAVKHIHEFIADKLACNKQEKSEYALLLLSNLLGTNVNQLQNNFFNQSLIKRRIIMLNKTKSSRTAIVKYGFCAPLFAGMLVVSSAFVNTENVEKVKAALVIQPLAPTITPKAASPKIEALPAVIVKKEKIFAKEEVLATTQPQTNVSETLSVTNEISTIDTTSNMVYDFAKIEVHPAYPGGIAKFYEYVGKNYKYPKEAVAKGVSGRLIINFVVEKDGSLTDIKILRDLGLGTGQEAVRILNESPKWAPGLIKGQPVRVSYTIPILLNMSSNSKTNYIPENAYIILNGKNISRAEFNKIDPKSIVKMDVVKDKSKFSEYGAPEYSEGVIIITTKQ